MEKNGRWKCAWPTRLSIIQETHGYKVFDCAIYSMGVISQRRERDRQIATTLMIFSRLRKISED